MKPDIRTKYDALIVGYGEVGQALHGIFQCKAVDIENQPTIPFHHDYMHIAFPYSEGFEDEVKRYQELYSPKYTIIHSTVPVGTSKRLGAVHTPIRGMHPNLEYGVRVHQKFLGGPQAWEVAEYFRDHGLRVIICDSAETTELGMLLGTECYRVNIEFAKHAKELCEKHGVNYNESYTLFANAYNDGFQRLGLPEYIRQVLVPIQGPVGGHCLVPNSELIKK